MEHNFHSQSLDNRNFEAENPGGEYQLSKSFLEILNASRSHPDEEINQDLVEELERQLIQMRKESISEIEGLRKKYWDEINTQKKQYELELGEVKKWHLKEKESLQEKISELQSQL